MAHPWCKAAFARNRSRSVAVNPPRALLLELHLGQRRAVHLVGPVGEAQAARLGPGIGEPEIFRHAPAPVHLDGAVDDVAGHLGCDHLDHVRTQLPYALTAAGGATIAYLIAGLLTV